MALPLLLFPDGDTLVYIDPAPKDGAQNLPRPTAVHRVHSDMLLATGSNYFQCRLGPRSQNRVRKQRGFSHKLPEGIKYVLDLTPPMLEEDAIISMTEVSCPMGIRTWVRFGPMWDLPSQCVGGVDECETVEEVILPFVLDTSPMEEDDENLDDEESADKEEEHALPLTRQRAGLPVEYSAKRHRDGIEQILHVLEGLNVILDTPCKLWTFFAVAKLFDVATVPAVGDLISSWFYMANNTRFIEIHPKIAYRVACGIKSQALCRDAFVGLVGDEAMLYLIRSGRLRPLKAWERHFARSRFSDCLDDIEVQRIEYASKSFAEDVIGHFLHLAGTDMTWLADIVEFRKLTQHIQNSPVDKNMVLALIAALRDYIRYKIYRALVAVRDPLRSSDTVPKRGTAPYSNAFRHRDILQRIIGKKFWVELLTLDFKSSGLYGTEEHSSIAEVGSGLLAFRGQKAARIRHPSHIWLGQRVDHFNCAVTRVNTGINLRAANSPTENEKKRGNFSLNHRSPLSGTDPSTSADANTTLPFRPAPGANAFTNIDVNISLPSRQVPSQKNPSSPSDEFYDVFDSIAEDMRLERLFNSDVDDKKFNLHIFFIQVSSYVRSYTLRLIYPRDIHVISLDATDTLTCLGDNQFQFLPLWAGGNDDGTGGVFTDPNIPIMSNGGFSAPGPAVHTGSDASTDDSFSEIGPSDSMSTIHGASHHATFSHMSDFMSVNSAGMALIEKKDEGAGHKAVESVFSDAASLVLSIQSSEEELDLDDCCDGVSTVIMGSPSLWDDTDADHPDIVEELDDGEFELI